MPQSKPSPKSDKPSPASNVLFAMTVLAVIAGGAILVLRPSSDPAGAAASSGSGAPEATAARDPSTAEAAAAAAPPEPSSPPSAAAALTAPPKTRPPADAPVPDIQLGQYSPARPVNQVRDAHHFAARHPEVLQYVPCFCGCEARGHVGNDDCFVASRDAQGRVTSWEPHGVSCAVCIDVAIDAGRMHSSGASVTQIRTAIENKYRPLAPSMTPTPMPPTETK